MKVSPDVFNAITLCYTPVCTIVGGALNQAKSSLSSWFSTLANDWKTTGDKNNKDNVPVGE